MPLVRVVVVGSPMWDSSGLWEVCEWPFRLQSAWRSPVSSQHMNCMPVGKHVGTEVWCVCVWGGDTLALVLLFFFFQEILVQRTTREWWSWGVT